MPTIFRWNGLRIVIYPNDHRPAHAHVVGPDAEAVYVLNCPHGPLELRESFRFRIVELNDLVGVLGDEIDSLNGSASMITEAVRLAAEDRMRETMRRNTKAVRVRYDRWRSAVVIRLESGMDLVLPKHLVPDLARASDTDLSEIEITPTGLGLHWPRLDADLYVPGLLDGVLGSRGSTASPRSAAGGSRQRA